ncbi:MAG: oligosaccharide flippase family protein [Bacteroidales bacterium]|jgi:O-antigen/teichoic acid export membrane protein|nr:oligosaccharide flippase family protein [Bacteroidales bacterium]
MQKKFLKNLVLLIVLNLLVKPLWIFGIDRQVQNLVGPEEYGLYYTIFNFSFLFFIFLDLGITNFNNRNIAQNNQLLSKHLAGIGTMKMMLGFLYALVIFGIAWFNGYQGRALYLLAWVGFNQFLLSFVLYLRSNLNGLLLFKTDSLISVLDRLLMIMICGFLLWTGLYNATFTIEWFVYGQTAAYLITAFIALIAVLNKAGKLRFNWNLPFFILIVKKSLPFASLVLLMSFYNRIDPVILARLLPKEVAYEQVGVYSQAFRLLDAGQNFAYLFAVLLLPLFAKMISKKQDVEHLTRLSFSILISGVLIIAMSVSAYSEQIMTMLYTRMPDETLLHFNSRIGQSATIFSVLMFSFVAISSNYVFGTLLTANNNMRLLNLVALGGVVINLGLNFILIPKFQSIGSAYAGMLAQMFTAVAQLFIVRHIFRFRVNYSLIFRFICLALFMVAMIVLLKNYGDFDWEISLLALVFSGLLASVALKLLSIKEFASIMKTNQ